MGCALQSPIYRTALVTGCKHEQSEERRSTARPASIVSRSTLARYAEYASTRARQLRLPYHRSMSDACFPSLLATATSDRLAHSSRFVMNYAKAMALSLGCCSNTITAGHPDGTGATDVAPTSLFIFHLILFN